MDYTTHTATISYKGLMGTAWQLRPQLGGYEGRLIPTLFSHLKEFIRQNKKSPHGVTKNYGEIFTSYYMGLS